MRLLAAFADLLLVATVTVAGAPPASATGSIVDADGHVLTPAGHPGAVFDTTTNLLWLDATETVGRSLADVQSELGPSGEFEGWKVARRPQIHRLFRNAGLSVASEWVSDASLQAEVQSLVGIWGQTDTEPAIVGTKVWHANTLLAPASFGGQSISWLTTDDRVWIGDNGTSESIAGLADPDWAVALVTCAAPGEGGSGVLMVNSTADDLTPGDGQCTLREAILNANNDCETTNGDCAPGSSADTIILPAGTYVLGSDEDLDIYDDLKLVGAGADKTVIDGAQLHSCVLCAFAANLELEDVKITGAGAAPFHFDGGIHAQWSDLSVIDCMVSENASRGVFVLNGAASLINTTVSDNSGGGLFILLGEATLTSTTVSDNLGGGLDIWDGEATLTSTTVSGHQVICDGRYCYGGVAIGLSKASLSMVNSTLARESDIVGSGGSSLTLVGTVIAEGNCGPDLSIISYGHNISSDSTCGLTDPTDLPNTDPILGALQDNGGPNLTHALLPGSPAIDAIPLADCTYERDQRGVLRPQGSACDIGAYEVHPAIDTDEDDVDDALDNCVQVYNPGQEDTDGDDYGNACDCDFDQSLTCSIADFNLFLPDFQAAVDSGVGCDMDANGTVGINDFNLFLPGFVAGVPGPSGLVP